MRSRRAPLHLAESELNGFGEAGEHEREGSEYDLRQLFVRGIARFYPWVLLTILVSGAIGAGIGLMQPNEYVSSAKLLLRMGARERLTAESLVEFGGGAPMPPPTMADELHMLADVTIFERVATELGPGFILQAADPEHADGELTSFPIRLMHRLQGFLLRSRAEASRESGRNELRLATKALMVGTTVVSEPGSSVILVAHRSTSPEKARTIVEALVRAFIARHREQYSIEPLLERSSVQLELAKNARDQATSAYVDGVTRSGLNELELQAPRLQAEFGTLEADLFEAQVRREEVSQSMSALIQRLQEPPAESDPSRPGALVPNEEYETQLVLKRLLLEQKQALAVLERPSKELRRREAELDGQIEKIDQVLAVTARSIPEGPQARELSVRAALEERLVELETELEALPVRIELLAARAASKHASLVEVQERLLDASLSMTGLPPVRGAAEIRYAGQLERFSALRALESIGADEEANLSLLQAPTLEVEKVGPKRGSMLLKSLLAGIFIGVAFAILRQRWEPKLRYPESFELARDVPVLGVVPDLSALQRLGERAREAAR